MYKFFFKRLLDIIISGLALLAIGWLIVLIAVFLHFANKGAGAFFFQERPGKDEKIFKVIKFKTMKLPQLINVFKGDMSLIGPRPLRVHYLPLYSPEQHRRHEVRPGISGWAQVNGRNNISWTEKFKLDVWYVDHCTFWTDIKIIFITIKNVLMRKDINNESVATMYPFDGTN